MTDDTQPIRAQSASTGDAQATHGSALGDGDARERAQRGTMVGRYLLLDELGSGAMGVVFSAFDPELNRKVAIKLLQTRDSDGHEDVQLTAQTRTRMVREARALAQLAHPNVIAAYDVGQWDGGLFIAMELVSGRSLRAWFQAHRDGPWQVVRDLMIQAGEGLAAAHAAGLIHRDFKPDNVLVGDDGRAYVVDFGLVKREGQRDLSRGSSAAEPTYAGDWTALTVAGDILGSPAYMSPEQLRGLDTDDKIDQFAFCVSFYEGVYGLRPHGGANLAELLTAIESGVRRRPTRRRRLPGALAKIIERGMSARPEHRFSSMSELLTQIRATRHLARDRGLLALASGAAVMACMLVVQSVLQAPSGQCLEGPQHWRSAFTATRRSTLELAFTGSKSPLASDALQRVLDNFDEHGQRWQASFGELCHAHADAAVGTVVQNKLDLDLGMACLERQLDEFVALAEVFGQADAATVGESVKMSLNLPSSNDCLDAQSLRAQRALPANPQQRARITELQRGLARASALVNVGKTAQAAQWMQSVSDEVDEVGFEPLAAEFALELGTIEYNLQNFADSARSFERGQLLAMLAGDPESAALALKSRIIVLAFKLRDRDAARELVPLGEALVERSGAAPGPRAALLRAHAIVLQMAGEHDAATAELELAVEIARDEFGAQSSRTAQLAQMLAVSYGRQGRDEQSDLLFEHTLDYYLHTLGERHPDVLRLLTNWGATRNYAGRHRAARDNHQRARETAIEIWGPSSVETLSYHSTWADQLLAEHRHGAAAEQYAVMAEIADANVPGLRARRASALAHQAHARAMQGEPFAARQALQRLDESLGQSQLKHVELDDKGLHRALAAAIALRDWPLARRWLARALPEREPGQPVHERPAIDALELAGRFYVQQGRPDIGLEYHRRSVTVARRYYHDKHADLGALLLAWGQSLDLAGRPAQALEQIERALVCFETGLGNDHPAFIYPLYARAHVRVSLGDRIGADQDLERARTLFNPDDHDAARFADLLVSP